jgi:hypothetical protein
LSTGFVDLIGPLAGISKDGHFITYDFQKPSGHDHKGIRSILAYQDFPGLQHGHQRSMVGQDP